jgi:hypothetical protein
LLVGSCPIRKSMRLLSRRIAAIWLLY